MANTTTENPYSINQLGARYDAPMYQIHILGEVAKSGTFRVPASTRLSEALDYAGNILGRGSTRSVELRRKGMKTKKIDLLAFHLFGDLNNNPYLLDNDVIFVPLKGNVVQIAGAVKRPAMYELTKKTTLNQLVAMAGGYTPGVYKSDPIKVIRHERGKKQLLEVEIDDNDTSHFNVTDADIVVVPHMLTKEVDFDYDVPHFPGEEELFFPSFENRVFVLGAVAKPGPFSYSPYYNVGEYLTQAGGLTKLAKSEKKIYLLSSSGEKKKIHANSRVNPGDTIVVPERYMPPESMVQLVLGITSAALGITTTVLALTR